MRIAIVTDSLSRGGAERQALVTVRELARRGHTAELIYYHDAPDSYDPATCAPGRAVRLSKSGGPLGLLYRLRSHLRRGRFEVMHAFKEWPIVYGCLASRAAGIPARFASYRCQIAWPGITRRALRVADRIATAWLPNSRGVAETLVEYLGVRRERIQVVHNGLDPAAFRSALSPDEARSRLGLATDAPTVTLLAALRPEKNHELFVRTAALVARRRPAARFLAVGDTGRDSAEYFDRIRRLVGELGVGDRVLFLGQRDDVAAILAATDVSILTSDHEGLSNALIESMAAGRAVITTDYRGAEDVVTHHVDGLITPRNDAEALAEHILALLDDPLRRAELGRAAMATVQNRFSLNAMTDRLLELYQHYLSQTK